MGSCLGFFIRIVSLLSGSKRSELGLFSAIRSDHMRRFFTDRAAPPVFKQPLLGCIPFLRSIVFELGSVPGGLTDKLSCYQRVLELCPVSESTLINLAESCVVWARQSFTPSSEIRLDCTPVLSPAGGKCFSSSLALLSVGWRPTTETAHLKGHPGSVLLLFPGGYKRRQDRAYSVRREPLGTAV
jgi:hypothetical protein